MVVNAQDVYEQAATSHRQGRLAEAAALYRKCVEMDARQVRAWSNLGHTLRDMGQLDEAVGVYQRALSVQPGHVGALTGLGNALRMLKRYDSSVAAYRAALQGEPNQFKIHHNLGMALLEKGDRAAAIASFRRMLELEPRAQGAYTSLLQALGEEKDNAAGLEAARKAVSLWPECADFYAELGRFLFMTDRIDESVPAYRRAVELDPSLYLSHNNLGNSLRQQGKFDEARAEFARALALKPDLAGAHWNMALLRLLDADLPGAWEEYEWRWQVPELTLKHDFTQPRWDGSDLRGRRILLHAEQGFGDTLHFARYAPLVAARGGEVIMASQIELVWLMQGVEGVRRSVPLGQPLPDFDVHCPIMSLANIFRTTLDTIPANVPYLRADADRSARWRRRFEGDARRRVGIFWSGHKAPDLRRSATLADWAELARVPNVRWVSLQKGPGAVEARTPPDGWEIDNWTEELIDFSDTAALMDCMDLVITIDSAAAHLAGGLGKPVWLMLPRVPTWRWMMDRADSPWYPTMRIIRQERPGDWSGPAKIAAEALRNP